MPSPENRPVADIHDAIRRLDVAHQRLQLTQEVVEEQSAILKAIYDTVPSGVVILDPDGQVTSFNRCAEDITGYRFEEVLGQDYFSAFRMDGEGETRIREGISRGEPIGNMDVKIVDREGRGRTIRINMAPLVEKSGRIEGSIQTFMDVTEEKRVEEIIRTNHDRMVSILSSLIELRDPHMKGHCERVALYSEQIARRLGWTDSRRLAELRYASILHDIGMIALPDQIWSKKDGLTWYEVEHIRKHPVESERIVSVIEGFENVRSMIRHHHEFYNGKGYPDELAGDKIPDGARIIGVAEAYDAMSQARSNRPPLSRGVVLKELRENRGKQFDPAATDALLELIELKGPGFR